MVTKLFVSYLILTFSIFIFGSIYNATTKQTPADWYCILMGGLIIISPALLIGYLLHLVWS